MMHIKSSERTVSKRVNIKFLLISSAVFTVLTVCVYFLHGMQIEGNADKLKERAVAAEAEGDYAKAVRLLGQYLNFREGDYDSLLHFVRLRDGLATTSKALYGVMMGYEEVLRRDEDRADETEIRQDLVAVAMSIGEFSIALHHLETLLTDEKFQEFCEAFPKQQAELRFHLGQCHQVEGRLADAWDSYLQAVEGQPGQSQAYLSLADLLANHSDSLPRRMLPKEDESEKAPKPLTLPEKIHELLPLENERDFEGRLAADRVLEWMIENAEEPGKTYLARAEFRFQQGRLEEARQDVKLSRSLNSSDRGLFLFSGQLAIEQAHDARFRGNQPLYVAFLKRARQDVEAGRTRNPEDARFDLLQALIESEAREGLGLLPAVAEKLEETPLPPQGIHNSQMQAQWTFYERAELVLREGQAKVQESLKALKTQKPVRTRLRIEHPDSLLNRYQLEQLNVQLRWTLADTLISQQEILDSESSLSNGNSAEIERRDEEVERQLLALEKAETQRGLVDFLRARRLMGKKDWKEAAWTLEQTRLLLANRSDLKNRIDLLLDQCYGQMGNPDQQIQVAERALGDNPDWLPALVRLPVLYQRTNRPQDAIRAYEKIEHLPGVASALARLKLDQELAKPTSNRRWDEIHAALASQESANPSNPAPTLILRAELLVLEADQLASQGQKDLAQEKYQAAVTVLDEGLNSLPDQVELWAARARLELRLPVPENRTPEERIAAAEKILQQAQAAVGNQVALALTAAQIAMLYPLAEAIPELSALEKLEFPAPEQAEFFAGLAQVYRVLANRADDPKRKSDLLERSLNLQQQAARLRPDEIASQIALAEIALAVKDRSAIAEAIGRVEKLEGPTGPNGNYLKAIEILQRLEPTGELSADDKNAVARARELLNQAMKERPFWAAVPHLLGDLEWDLVVRNHRGKLEERARLTWNPALVSLLQLAMAHYQKAFELRDRSSEMINRMIEFYLGGGQTQAADEFLRKVAQETSGVLSGDLARRQWQVALRQGRVDDAVEAADDIAARSGDFRDHILASRLRFSRGERGPAVLDPLLKACQLAPKEAQPWLELVTYHARLGQLEEAKAAIEKAEASIENDPPFRLSLTLARCYELLNDRDEAEPFYQAALSAIKGGGTEQITVQVLAAEFFSRSPRTDPERQAQDLKRATSILDRILSNSDAPASVREWARCHKALVVALPGRFEDTERALEVLARGRSGEISLEDREVEIRIRLARNRHLDHLALIRLWEPLAERGELKSPAQRLLAASYDATGQTAKARRIYEQILESDDNDSPVRVKLLSNQIANGKWDEAQRELAALKREHFGSFAVALLEASLSEGRGETQTAVRQVEEAVKDLEDEDSLDRAIDDLALGGSLARTLDSLEQYADQKRMISALPLIRDARLISGQGNQDQAIELLKRQLPGSGLESAIPLFQLKTAAGFLEIWKQFAAAEPILREVLKRSGRPEDVLPLAANLARQGRVEEALSLCQAAWSTCSPESVGGTCVAIVRTKKASAQEVKLAESQLLSGIKTHPESLGLKVLLADLRDFQGQYEEAEAIYVEILKTNPNHIPALNNLAWLTAVRAKNPGLAMRYINHAVVFAEKMIGPVPELLDTRAVVYLQAGYDKEALRDMETAINVASESAPLTYLHLAQSQLANGNITEAKRSFRRAKSLTEDDIHPLERDIYQSLAKQLGTP